MLQQTQVRTVTPYWLRWMRELPDVESLARADPDRVLKLWEGLGYYSRARNLHSAAQCLVQQHGGRFPQCFDEVLSLPGVGRYTAGAICSIAFNQPTPILDGNVLRVLTRIHGIHRNPRDTETNQRLWRLASELVLEAERIPANGEKNCSDLNQALMELGALVCTPKQPRCPACPVRNDCVALRKQRVSEIPSLDRRPAITQQRFAAFVVETNGRFVVRQRPAGVINARLWEFPNVELPSPRSSIQEAAAVLFGPGLAPGRRFLRIKHSITKFRITLDVYRIITARLPKPLPTPNRLLSSVRLHQLAFTSAHRKILNVLEDIAPSMP